MCSLCALNNLHAFAMSALVKSFSSPAGHSNSVKPFDLDIRELGCWFVWGFFCPNQFNALFNPTELNFSVKQHLVSGASQFPLLLISFFLLSLGSYCLILAFGFGFFFLLLFCPVLCPFHSMFLSCLLYLLSPQTATKIVAEEILVS